MFLKLPHNLKTEAAAILRAKQALNDMRRQLPPNAKINKEEWQGNTLAFDVTADKINVTGTVVVTATDYELTAKLPLMLRMFESRIEKAIKEQTAGLLDQ